MNFATKVAPLTRIFFPFSVCNVLLFGISVTSSVPMPGMANGGAV